MACQPAAPRAQPSVGAPPSASAGAPSQQSPEVRRLVEAAKQANETELSIVWSQSSLGGSDGARQYEALFNRMYDLNVRLRFTPGPSMQDVAGKVTQEVAAGQTATTDVLLGTATHYAPLVDRGVLESFDYTQLSPRITRDIVAPGNIGVEVGSFVTGITYNSDLVPTDQVPRRLADVLQPQWRGKIASTPYAAHFEGVAARPEWTPDRLKDFVTRFSPYVGGLIRCGENSRLITGEFVMLVVDCGSYYVRQERARGAPLAQVLPEDTPALFFWYMGVPRTAAHPNLAKLFVNMVVSKEGQEAYYDLWFTDHYALPGSQSAAELSDLRARGVQPARIDARVLIDQPELRTISDDLAKILIEKPGG
jgi:iron(III) transport system substrate-binding protein